MWCQNDGQFAPHRRSSIGFSRTDMLAALAILTLIRSAPSTAQCLDQGSRFPENYTWIRDEHFNVTCRRGQVEVLNCVSDRGTTIPLMTLSFWENGVEYSCIDDEVEESSGEKPPSPCVDRDEHYHQNFVLSCITNRFIACMDKNGDILNQGLFLLENSQLKSCKIYSEGTQAQIEDKGCFNGTDHDDINDETLHIPLNAIWREGEFDKRCGDQGIHIYRCYVREGITVDAGFAWIDPSGTIQGEFKGGGGQISAYAIWRKTGFKYDSEAQNSEEIESCRLSKELSGIQVNKQKGLLLTNNRATELKENFVTQHYLHNPFYCSEWRGFFDLAFEFAAM